MERKPFNNSSSAMAAALAILAGSDQKNILAPITENKKIGSGLRRSASLRRRIWKSHAGKPKNYVKPYGVRPGGYAAHGNGRVRMS